MTKFKGWDRVYSGKTSEGSDINAPKVREWRSIFGEQISVSRNHYWDRNEVRYFDEGEIPDGQNKWVVKHNHEQRYFSQRTEAVAFARELMDGRYDEDEVKRARRKLRNDE